MKNKDILLARHGLRKEDVTREFHGDLCNAGKLLRGAEKMVKELGHEMTDEMVISLLQETAKTIESPGRGMLIDPVHGDVPLSDFDPYIRGVVRWMNELGILTIGSCDGHRRGPAKIYLLKYPTGKQIELLKAVVPPNLRLRIDGKNMTILYKGSEISSLLDMAKNLYLVWKNPANVKEFQANHFKSLLVELLAIPGVSTDERAFRQRLRNKLSGLIDHTFIDRKGNLLGFVEMGNGPTILLSAHMDTVTEIVENRKIIEDGTILKSSEGILGADDRAGVAAILEVLSRVQKTNFLLNDKSGFYR